MDQKQVDAEAQLNLAVSEGDVNKQAEVQAEIDRIAGLRNKANQRKQDKVDKARASQREKERDFEIDRDLKAARRAGDVRTEVALEREVREKKEMEKIRDAFEGDQIRQQQEFATAKKRIDAELVEFEKKRLEEIANANKTANKTKVKRDDNDLASKRASIEQDIANKLVSQVNSLREAKELIMFLNRFRRSNQSRAERTSLQTLAAQRRLNNLRDERRDIAEAGGDTTRIDNEIARAQIDLSIKSGVAAEALGKVGSSASALQQSLSNLNNSVKAAAPKTNPAVRANPTIVPPNQGAVNSGNTFTTEFNITGVQDPEQVAEMVEEKMDERFRNVFRNV